MPFSSRLVNKPVFKLTSLRQWKKCKIHYWIYFVLTEQAAGEPPIIDNSGKYKSVLIFMNNAFQVEEGVAFSMLFFPKGVASKMEKSKRINWT